MAIVLGLGMVAAAVAGVLMTPWITIGASVLVIAWLAVMRRRSPEKRVYRTHL